MFVRDSMERRSHKSFVCQIEIKSDLIPLFSRIETYVNIITMFKLCLQILTLWEYTHISFVSS